METTAISIDVPVSTVLINGFAAPPVVVLELNLATAELPFMAAAVPPPAMMANAQVTIGSKLVIVATITAVPAKVASGKAMASKRLSNHGM